MTAARLQTDLEGIPPFFLGRQPILDRNGATVAYELLFRSALDSYGGQEENPDQLGMIANSLMEMGLEELTGDRRAFINFTRSLLMQDVQHVLPPEYVTVEVPADLDPDQDVLLAIRKLKDGDGNYLWQAPDLRTGEPGQLLGVNYFVNQDMADIATGTKPIIYGAMERYVMRMVRQFAVRRLVERYADYHQVGFVGFARMDGELIDTSAVKHLVMA